MDYESPSELGAYLKYLDTNKTAFNSYFKWKQHVLFDDHVIDYTNFICEMCIHLHLEAFFGLAAVQGLVDFSKYWNVNQCVVPEFLNIIRFKRV